MAGSYLDWPSSSFCPARSSSSCVAVKSLSSAAISRWRDMFAGSAGLNRTSLPVVPLCALLDDVAAVVIGLDTETYVATPMAPLSGSIGQHVRHLVDHVAA